MREISVSTLVRYLKNKLESDNNLQRFLVCGEITNFHHHFSGHLYFSLKDETSQISCVMFKSAATTLKFEPKNGDKVIACANTSIFETSGQLQLYVLKMNLDGQGDLYQQYLDLKDKLEKQGYFASEHKISLTKTYLDKAAILVGDNSAAMSDIKTTFARRWPIAKIDFYPVLVQGNDAPSNIIETLVKVDQMNYDAIILARGGGSFEDLFCFNNEALVKCIYGLKTFIISGVGHEQDFTLVDFVCDLRAPTPTASVELITPNIIDVIDEVDDLQSQMNDLISSKYNDYSMRFDYLVTRLSHYQSNLKAISEQIDYRVLTLKNLIQNNIDSKRQLIKYNIDRVNNISDLKLNTLNLTLKRLNTLLEAYKPDNVLKRGYSYVSQDDRIVKNLQSLKNEEFTVNFIDGSIKAHRS